MSEDVVVDLTEDAAPEVQEQERMLMGGPAELFGCPVAKAVNGSMWYCAGKERVQTHQAAARARLRLPASATSQMLLGVGERGRLQGYESILANEASSGSKAKRQRRSATSHADLRTSETEMEGDVAEKVAIVDLTQDPGYAQTAVSHLPCLLTRCHALWCFQHQRVMMADEALMSQGIPIIAEASRRGLARRMPFSWGRVTQSVKESELYAMAGNGLCLPVVGAFVLWIFTSFQVLPQQQQQQQQCALQEPEIGQKLANTSESG